MDDPGEFETIVAIQHEELMAASAAETDLDLAFRLQMKEAIAASLALHPSSSSSSSAAAVSSPPLPDPENDGSGADISLLIAAQASELDRFRQERRDSEQSLAEFRRATEDLRRKAHDERFAREILEMPDGEWEDRGDEFERPIEDHEIGLPFRLYFKGMTSAEDEEDQISAIGVAVCDPNDNLVLKVQKRVPDDEACREALEAMALIEGLDAVISLEIKRVDVFYDHRALYNHVTGIWAVKQKKVADLVGKVSLLKNKLESCQISLVPRCHIKFVYRLAREVIDGQVMKNAILNGKGTRETCNICLEVTYSSQMFTVDSCSHRFCISCMKQHAGVKLLNAMLPGCPHEGCKNMLNVEGCRKFLSPRLLGIMIQRIKEESIPVNEKLYCPYPKCSALMSTSEAIDPQQASSSKQLVTDASGLRKCIKCLGSFCIKCKVPWHEKMSCYEYKRLNPQPREDAKLKSLAKQKLWRQCVKCNHMIELAEGCFHMTCRCKYEFCYTCGAEWKDKKPTCSCPLWQEDNIMYGHGGDEGSEYDDDNDVDDEDDYW